MEEKDIEPSITRDDVVFFWRIKHHFSQWYPSTFIVNNIMYNRAEQYMMAQKALLFGDHEIYNKIMSSNNPRVQKALGRGVKGFKEGIWEKNCEQIVFEANFAKFSQNLELKQILLDTRNKTIVEASPYDKIWGVGMSEDDPDILNTSKWGQNRLGKILMKVRETLKKENNL